MKPEADAPVTRPDSHDDTPHAHAPRPTFHAHAHEHEHAPDGGVPSAFPHDKLDAYRVACELAALAHTIAARIPRGHRNIADHLLRSASNTVLLLAEGANRRGTASKRQRFAESRGECAEVAAAGDLLLAMDIGPRHDAEQLKCLASRVSAMLTGLIERLR